jgi:hypothetical protein
MVSNVEGTLCNHHQEHAKTKEKINSALAFFCVVVVFEHALGRKVEIKKTEYSERNIYE